MKKFNLMFCLISFLIVNEIRAQSPEIVIDNVVALGTSIDGLDIALEISYHEIYAIPTGPIIVERKTCKWSNAAGGIPCSGGECKLVRYGNGRVCLICQGSSEAGSDGKACHEQALTPNPPELESESLGTPK